MRVRPACAYQDSRDMGEAVLIRLQRLQHALAALGFADCLRDVDVTRTRGKRSGRDDALHLGRLVPARKEVEVVQARRLRNEVLERLERRRDGDVDSVYRLHRLRGLQAPRDRAGVEVQENGACAKIGGCISRHSKQAVMQRTVFSPVKAQRHVIGSEYVRSTCFCAYTQAGLTHGRPDNGR